MFFEVSVPLRGLWFLSAEWLKYIPCRYEVVSVPLRGLWFLSKKKAIVVSIMGRLGFRPLTGIMVLIKGVEQWGEIALNPFPSPYGDYGSYPHPL